MTPPEHGADQDPELAWLLRWYPRAWRERYGGEFLALVEDTLDGRRPGWRLRLGVARAGLRERCRALSGPAGKRAESRWGTFLIVGGLVGVTVDDAGRHPPAAGAWQAAAAMTALAALAAVTGAAVVAAGAVAWPSFVRFLRAGGWPEIRRRIAWAAAMTTAAAGTLTWLILLQAALTPAQMSSSPAYTVAFGATALLSAATIGLWATVVTVVKKHLHLAPRSRAAETLLGAVISTGILAMVPVEIIWFGAVRSSAFWLGNGLVLLAANAFTASLTLQRARRRARRQRAAAVAGR